MESLTGVFERLVDAVRYPLDDPNQTLIAVLALVVAGLLVAIILIAVASPNRRREDPGSDEGPSGSEQDSSAE